MENNLINKFVEITGHESVAEYFEGAYGLITQKSYADKWVIKVKNGIEVCVSKNDFKVVEDKTSDKIKNINLDEIYRKIDEILYIETEPVKEVIREHIKAKEPLYFKYTGSLVEDTNNMFTYAMKSKDIYDKAYVMKSVVDRVLEQYFKTLKEIKLRGDIKDTDEIDITIKKLGKYIVVTGVDIDKINNRLVDHLNKALNRCKV